MRIEFQVLGEPQGKARPRVTRNGAYTPEKTKQYQSEIAMAYQRASGGYEFNGLEPLRVEISAEFKIPNHYSKQRKEQALSGKLAPQKKPDLDNIAKVVLDALNKLAYKDDCKITELLCKKRFSNEPKVSVTIENIGEG